MNIPKIKHDIAIPEGVSVAYQDGECSVKGPRGELTRRMYDVKLKLETSEEIVSVSGKNVRRKGKALLGTWKAHLNNMINGVNSGFRYEMKVVYSHFPMKVAVKGDVVVIDNYLGEKAPRNAVIVGESKVVVKGKDISIEGNDKEAVGQTAANIEQSTSINNRDRRVFQDGIYVVNKGAISE
ncbi:MAG: 50S ribosomal protein L6 [Marine Group III euryarchaeote CG-Bathy1]|uniref:Large ribosomal subunit protein uL6 n=1 Tax=Marine Group III euryarchaeote CG-Bathy1 TaxID=1889001 RepID=A0A1J5TQF5_9ARCH|nr:MAG: 50S ribosomal protein L6 [Marine Group III euryarchaeote CG-Bathy1]